jgi:hypothetical protein
MSWPDHDAAVPTEIYNDDSNLSPRERDMSSLKCPNPSCSFVFDPSLFPPGSVLTCPRCAMQFTLGPSSASRLAYPPGVSSQIPAAAAGYPGYPPSSLPGSGYSPGYAAAHPAYPPGYPPPPPYAAPPANPNQAYPTTSPPGSPFSPAAPGLEFAEESESRDRSKLVPKRRSGDFGSAILAIAGVMMLLMIGLTFVFFAIRSKQGLISQSEITSTTELRNLEFNFALAKPPEGWLRDQETQNSLGVNVVAYRRSEPVAWVALGVSDFEKRNPKPYELQKKMTDQLLRVFDNLPEQLATKDGELAGHPAQLCEFRGVYKPTGDTCFGYCYLLAYQGIGYWLYLWAPERNFGSVGQELMQVKAGFRTLDLRDDWKERAPQQRVYLSPDKTYRVTDYERLWEKPKRKDPKDEDELADLFLQAQLKSKERNDFPPTADFVVLILGEAAGDPLAAARDYIERRYKRIPEISVQEWTGEPAGDPPVGPEENDKPVVRLKVSYGSDALRSADKLVVFTAIPIGDRTIVAEGSCSWRERAIWERRLMQLTRSLRPNTAMP